MTPAAPALSASASRALVIDDEKNIRGTIRLCLEGLGCEVVEAATPEAALAALRQRPFDLAFLDLRLGTADGLEVLPQMLAESPLLDVIVITAYATFEAAVEAIRRGARDFLPKPFTPAQIRHVVDRAREQRGLTRRLGDLESRLAEAAPEVLLDTASAPMRAALTLVRQAASSDASVLFRGESGTGKGVLARILHSESARAARPFVTVNCPTLTENLLTSELFGHARGAFTGAVKDQPGRVEQAEGGTLFLDEVGEMSPALQGQLLRFVQEKKFERLGEGKVRAADVRVLAATNRHLEEDVRAGRFREDLLFRLNVVEVVVPPLRERREDILPLAQGFLAFFARNARRRVPALSREAQTMLQGYAWPGNVRELRNALERALIVCAADEIPPQAFPERIATSASPHPVTLGGPHSLDAVEQEHTLRVLASMPSLEDAARILGIDASTLYRKRKKWETP